ncbi:MAG: PfkB family carbohydrate kinase [Candidatus Solibacter sp.]
MADLPLHSDVRGAGSSDSIVIIGEVLWDVFPDSACLLGGAPLNFSVHASRLGLHPVLISTLGSDDLGRRAAAEIRATGLDMGLIGRSAKWGTGTASVALDADGQPHFQITRPAAYDDLTLTDGQLSKLQAMQPAWIYYGTLFAARAEGHATLQRLLEALPQALRFYDVNLRPGADRLELVCELLSAAHVVKLNESEAESVGQYLDLPGSLEAFCRQASARFGWRAVCVTLGEHGCAMLARGEFVRANGIAIKVADTVGAGDAFAAAFVHGLSQEWPVEEIARFANRVGAIVASRAGAIPEWSILETVLA